MRVLGCGALNVDYLFAADALVTDGETFCYAAERQPGGSAANTIYALARLGVACRFAGVTGDDPDGLLARESLAAAGVDTGSITVKPGATTGRVFCFVDKAGHRALYVCPGVNSEVTATDLRRGLDATVTWVHASSFVGDAAFEAHRDFVAALPPGTRFSFAPGAIYSARGLAALRPFLARCTLLFLTVAELRALTGQAEPLAGAAQLLATGVGTVVVTRGGEGSLQAASGWYHAEPAIAVTVRDTTGAGDAFAAGFIFGWVRGWSPVVAQRFATVVASFAVEGWGARASLPSFAAAKERFGEVYGVSLP